MKRESIADREKWEEMADCLCCQKVTPKEVKASITSNADGTCGWYVRMVILCGSFGAGRTSKTVQKTVRQTICNKV